VKHFLENAYNNAKTILTKHNKELHALANALLEHETLTGAQINNILAQLNNKQQQEHSIEAPQKTTATPASPASSAATAAAAAVAAAQQAAAKAKGVAGIGS
jgi:ATP-dependent metalloprotease